MQGDPQTEECYNNNFLGIHYLRLISLDLHHTCSICAVNLAHLVLDGVVSLLDLLLETLDVLLQVADDVVQLGCLRLQLLDLLLVVVDLLLKAGELHTGNTA